MLTLTTFYEKSFAFQWKMENAVRFFKDLNNETRKIYAFTNENNFVNVCQKETRLGVRRTLS